MEIKWFNPKDKSKSVFDAKEHSKSSHRENVDESLVPKRAVLFCMGKAMGIIKKYFIEYVSHPGNIIEIIFYK